MNTSAFVPAIASIILLLASGCSYQEEIPENNESATVTSEERISTDFPLHRVIEFPGNSIVTTDSQIHILETPVETETIDYVVAEPDAAAEQTPTLNTEKQPEVTVGVPTENTSDTVVSLAAPAAETANCGNVSGAIPVNSTPPIAGSWTLEFQDEFIDNQVDGSKWKLGQDWAGINGLAANQPDNISVDCGYLTITAEKQAVAFSGKDYAYTTGELSTFKRFRQRYGYFEARIRYDAIQGLWPAFWLMPDRGLYGNTNKNHITYLKFDLNNENRSSVDSAILELHIEAADDGVQNLVLQRIDEDNWSENNITWKNRPLHDPLWIEQRFDQQWKAGDLVRFDITQEVNQALAGDKLLSLALTDTFMRSVRVSFASKESIHTDRQPRLMLAGVSEPLVVTEDASVCEGITLADSNFGSEPLLHVEESWKQTASTTDGGMEFDILESLGHWGDHRTAHAMHWGGYGKGHQSTGSGMVAFHPTADGFHTYGLNWQPGHVEFYVDGNKTYEWTNERIGSIAGYIILGLQMGGWADGLGDNRIIDEALIPGEMVVDYVRVWSGE